jgi:hypothetical protein
MGVTSSAAISVLLGALASSIASADPPPDSPPSDLPPGTTTPPPATTAPENVPGATCTIRGKPLMPKGTTMYDAATGGAPIGTFTGQSVDVSITDLPADGSSRRAKVRTGGGLRLDGWAAPDSVPMTLSQDLPVVPNHIWLSEGVQVRFVSGSSDGLKVEAHLGGPFAQTVRAVASCTALSLDPPKATGWDPPGNARGYVAAGERLDLFAGPSGSSMYTVQLSQSGAGLLLFSTQTDKGFVHVRLHDDLVIDAWAPLGELTALKQGEMMDQAAGTRHEVSGARLAIDGTPTIVRALRDVPVRLSSQDAARPIGVIESGAEVYVMETLLGWSSVLPRNLTLTPPGDHAFWVRSSEIGVGSKGHGVAPRSSAH